MPERPLKVRELLAKLKPYGIKSLTKRGKGSERILIKPIAEDGPPNDPKPLRGPQIPIKDHGEGTEITIPVIRAVLRRFDIDEDEFWE
jgi:hypothetical protein